VGNKGRGGAPVKKGRGLSRRHNCYICRRRLTIHSPEISRWIEKGSLGGDIVIIVCNAECEKKAFRAARLVNLLLHGEAVTYESGAVLRHDLVLKHGVGTRDGAFYYPGSERG
jgi:hypothetical protein